MKTLSYRGRITLLALLAGAMGLALLSRLFAMQVVGSARFREAAEGQIAYKRPIHARRGRILDAKGRELAVEETGYELTVRATAWRSVMHRCPRCGLVRFLSGSRRDPTCRRCKTRLEDVDRTDVARLARLLDVSAAELVHRVETSVDTVDRLVEKKVPDYLPPRQAAQERARLLDDYGWRPRRIARDVPYEVAREVELNPERNPAFRIEAVHTRRACGGRDFAHIVGFVRQQSSSIDDFDERVEMSVGASGIEAAFDEALRGETGSLRIMRDPRDGDTRIVERYPVRHGIDVRLTISAEDQALGAAALGGAEGAIVVVNAEDGSVLVAATSPSYEPGTYGRTLEEIKERKERTGRWPKHHALQDSAFGAFDIPGSIVKPVTAVAALLSGVATPDTRVECDRNFRNRRGDPLTSLRCSSAHGETDLHEALVRSCNVYFQTLQKRAIEEGRFDAMFDVARRFGFGLPTGIEVEPSPFPDTYDPGKNWAENIWMAIGQGKVTLSPAQIARAYAGLATGALPRLHLVADVGGTPVRPERTPLGIDESVLRVAREALAEAPRRGTATGHGLERWPISVKTGTAQLGGTLQNAWLAGFLPAFRGRPPVAFALVVFETEENGAQACASRLEEFLRGFYAEGAQ